MLGWSRNIRTDELIANTGHRKDQFGMACIFFQLFPQARNMHIDSPRHGI